MTIPWPPPPIDLPAHPAIGDVAADVPGWLFWPLLAGVGTFWLPAYALAVYLGFTDRRVGVPVFVVPINLAWELVHAFALTQWETQRPINFAAAFIDLFIIWQVWRFGHEDYPGMSRRAFRASIAGLFVLACVFMVTMSYELGDEYGIYSAVGINILLSWAFIGMLLRRGSSAGQSVYVALFKFIGSFSSGWFFFFLFPDRYLLMLCAVVYGVIDVAYIVLLHKQIRAEGRSPWRPWRDRSRPAGPPSPPRTVPAPQSIT